MTWSGGYVGAHASALTDLDVFSARDLPAVALADFRAFASKQGVTIPPEGDALLREMLMSRIAYARWGSEGAYAVNARRDGAVREASAGFARARELIEWQR